MFFDPLYLMMLVVELDASARAKRELERWSLVMPGEKRGVSAVLGAAAMTYVAAALGGRGDARVLRAALRVGGLGTSQR